MIRTLVYRTAYGKLCNRMFRLGNLIAFACDHGLEVVDFTFTDNGYAALFEGTAGREVVQFAPHGREPGAVPGREELDAAAVVHNLQRPYRLDYEALRALGTETVCFDGFHFQADASVERHRETLRAFFRPLARHRHEVDAHCHDLRADDRPLVGVHLRLTDFRIWADGRYFFDASVYAAYAKRFAALWDGRAPLFVVFTDEEIDLGHFGGLQVLAPGRCAIEDLYMMSKCDYLIAPAYSTFSGWASFYGGVPIYEIDGPGRDLALADFRTKRVLNNVMVGVGA